MPDDDLVFRIESLPADHAHDEDLLAVVRSFCGTSCNGSSCRRV